MSQNFTPFPVDRQRAYVEAAYHDHMSNAWKNATDAETLADQKFMERYFQDETALNEYTSPGNGESADDHPEYWCLVITCLQHLIWNPRILEQNGLPKVEEACLDLRRLRDWLFVATGDTSISEHDKEYDVNIQL